MQTLRFTIDPSQTLFHLSDLIAPADVPVLLKQLPRLPLPADSAPVHSALQPSRRPQNPELGGWHRVPLRAPPAGAEPAPTQPRTRQLAALTPRSVLHCAVAGRRRDQTRA